jgi:hypothetical protein
MKENKMPSPTTVVTGSRAIFGISDGGQLMGSSAEAGIASVEPEGIYEHLAIGVLEEGYTLAYKLGGVDNVKYDVYASTSGIILVGNEICRDDSQEVVKVTESKTDDDLIKIRQTFIASKNTTRVIIRMEITNCSRESRDLEDLLIKRYADIDVDTGGSAGWASFQARWDKTRYSVFSYNLDGDAPKGKRAHVVNMVAMPSDLPLDGTFVGRLGSAQYAQRDNPNLLSPLPTNPTDGDGILQWRASQFLAGETIRINMYYDTFRSFSK